MSLLEVVLIVILAIINLGLLISLFFPSKKLLKKRRELRKEEMEANLEIAIGLLNDLNRRQTESLELIRAESEAKNQLINRNIKTLQQNFINQQNNTSKLLLEKFQKFEEVLKLQNENIINQKEDYLKKTELFNHNIKVINENLINVAKEIGNLINAQNELKAKQTIPNNFPTQKAYKEVSLDEILTNTFGPESKGLWSRQSNIIDNRINFLIHSENNKHQKIGINDKFPLENYFKMNQENNELEIGEAKHQFIYEVKTLIRDLRFNYLDNGRLETLIIYISSDSIFQDICERFYEQIFAFAIENEIYLASPSSINIFLSYVNKNKESQHELKNSESFLDYSLNNLKNDFED